MKNELIEVFCEIIEDHPRVTLLATISLIIMFFVVTIESIGLTTWVTDIIAISVIVMSAIGLSLSK